MPASTWDAILSHIRDPADAARLADSARDRLLYRYAIPLYRHAADGGDEYAAGGWPSCWPSAATWTELRARADAGDEDAAWRLAGLLAERGDLDELRARADAGDGHAARRLAELLAERGDLDELRARADAGDGNAAGQLADLLVKQGWHEEAERLRRFGLNPDGAIACALTHSAERPASAQSPRTAGDPARIRGGAARSAAQTPASVRVAGGHGRALQRRFVERPPRRVSRPDHLGDPPAGSAVRPAARWCLP